MNRDFQTTVVKACAVDVGYSNVKYSSGRAEVGGKVQIRTGVFPALAPVLTNEGFHIREGSPSLDGTIVSLGGMRYFVGGDVRFHASGSEPRTIPSNYCESDEYRALLNGSSALHRQGRGFAAIHGDRDPRARPPTFDLAPTPQKACRPDPGRACTWRVC